MSLINHFRDDFEYPEEKFMHIPCKKCGSERCDFATPCPLCAYEEFIKETKKIRSSPYETDSTKLQQLMALIESKPIHRNSSEHILEK